MKKPVISIDSAAKRHTTQYDPPPTPANAKRKNAGFMTRRTFAGLLFGMGHTIKTAMRETNISTEAATEEIIDHGHAEWRRRRDAERRAA